MVTSGSDTWWATNGENIVQAERIEYGTVVRRHQDQTLKEIVKSVGTSGEVNVPSFRYTEQCLEEKKLGYILLYYFLLEKNCDLFYSITF